MRLHTVIKNNSVKLDGISVFGRNKNVSPTVYLNDFYKSYKEGTDIDELVNDVAYIFEAKRMMLQCPNMDFFRDYKKVSEGLVYKVINYSKNKELLETVPYIKYLNLAVVFYYLVTDEGVDNATILINNNHLELWGKKVEDIAKVASNNTPNLLSGEIRKLSEIICEEMNSEFQIDVEQEDDDTSMYVITNKKRIFGAACMLYPNLISEFAKKMDSDIYILPSSVHEVIVMPSRMVDDSRELVKMVREVNLTQVALEEVLSDNVYIYTREDNVITILE